MRLSLLILMLNLMLNMFVAGWCMARDDMLWMWANAVCAMFGVLSLMGRLESSEA